MKAPAKSLSVTSSSTKSVPPKPSTSPLERRVSRLTHHRPPPSPWRQPSGWSSMLTCAPLRTFSALKPKSKPSNAVRIRTRPKSFKFKLRIPSTPPA